MNDIDDEYRRAVAQDPSAPSETTRRRILAHAAEAARQRAARAAPDNPDFQRTAANQPSWRPSLLGTLAAAGLAGLLMTPMFFPSQAPPQANSALTVDLAQPHSEPAQSENSLLLPPAAPSAAPPLGGKRARPAPAPPQYVGVPNETGNALQNYAAPVDAGVRAQVAPPAARAPAAARNMAGPQAYPSNALSASTASSNARSMGAAPQALLGEVSPAPAPDMVEQAAEAGNTARLQSLLERPGDVNARDALGRTALMLATLRGHADAVNVLLAHGADVNAADANGLTPLQIAIAGAQPQIAAALQRAGAR